MDRFETLRYTIRRGAYHDSLVLMGVHAAMARQPGVVDAGAVMANPTNLDLLAASGLLPALDRADLGGGDLLVVVRAISAEEGDRALARLDEHLKGGSTGADSGFRPRSLAGARRGLPGAQWVAISVPGRYAPSLARDALDLDLHVFLYSDNVALDDEVELKNLARSRGRMVLGPDCGTAIVDGIGLGFANRVRRGPVGLIGASGTGLQAVSVALDRLGSGVSQAIGLGGRDLSSAVGGSGALAAFDLLAADPATEVVALVSKHPDADVTTRILDRATSLGRPVVLYFQGTRETQGEASGDTGLWRATSLSETASMAHALAIGERPERSPEEGPGTITTSRGSVRGLFAGGTVAAEALGQLSTHRPALHSNLGGFPKPTSATVDAVLDLGADTYTQGRPHPMIDPTPQAEALRQAGAEDGVGTILIDVVLGDGAHADPASIHCPAIEEALETARLGGRELDVIVILIGTERDPQDLADQRDRLLASGAAVVETVDAAVRGALGATPVRQRQGGDRGPDEVVDSIGSGSSARGAVINVGLETFHESLLAQGVETVHLDWRPPAGGNERLAAIIERLKRADREPSEATA